MRKVSYIENGSRTLYGFKHHAIQSSLYGVDIDPGAIEIAKLRLWLSLIVDEQDIKRIKPLPNLDYKIMQGNSLLEEFEGIKLFDEEILNKPAFDDKSTQIEALQEESSKLQKEFFEIHSNGNFNNPRKKEIMDELTKLNRKIKRLTKKPKKDVETASLFDQISEAKQKAAELKRLHQEFFDTAHKKEKDRIKQKIEKLTWELIEATLREQGNASKLPQIDKFKQSNIKPFFLWKLNFSEVFAASSEASAKDGKNGSGGFDVVIANPPYVGERGNKNVFREIRNGNLSSYYLRKMDIFYFFFHLAISISNKLGVIAFITTDYYPTATGAKKLRSHIKESTTILCLRDFSELRLFDAAKGQHNMITILSKSRNDSIARNFLTKNKGTADSELIRHILAGDDENTDYYEVDQKDLYDGEELYLRVAGIGGLGTTNVSTIINRLSDFPRLGTICIVNMGVQSGADFLGKKLLQRAIESGFVDEDYLKNNEIQVGDGIYVVNNTFYQGLSDHEKKVVKPFVKNSDLYHYYISKKDMQYYLYVDSEVSLKEYPRIYEHLNKFRPILRAREQVRNEDGSWYWIRGSKRKYLINTGQHIMCPYRSRDNIFALSDGNTIGAGDVYYISEKNSNYSIKYILALLNSKLYYHWFYFRGKRKGEVLELYKKPLSECPILQLTRDDQKPLVRLVEDIINITKLHGYLEDQEKKLLVRKLMNEIDQLVYSLYGLNQEEIKIVEGQDE